MSYNTGSYSSDFLNISSEAVFQQKTLDIFNYQYHNNTIYRQFCDALHTDITSVKQITEIPFLPISFYRQHKIITGHFDTIELIFESSGTTSENTSTHYVADEQLYKASLTKGFEQFYGNIEDYIIIALLPSYIERPNASLVYMAKVLMGISNQPDNGFYLNEWEQLANTLNKLEASGKKTLLLGVTFALLDFAEQYSLSLKNTIVMETGGMKGRREELTREQVHAILKDKFGTSQIHSEYGMTELLSQAYSKANGIFLPTQTMKALIRDINDPLEVKKTGNGCLNIIDLSNIYSCTFIATDDIGIVHENGSFEVLGRSDHSVLRGCNLMIV